MPDFTIRRTALMAATILCVLGGTQAASATDKRPGRGVAGSDTDAVAKFRQMGPEFRSPNIYRSASGAPGPGYWQQRANVDIDATLDESAQRITAEMDIEYVNNSPDTLNYIWLALDQNRFKDGSLARMSDTAGATGSSRGQGGGGSDSYSFSQLRYEQATEDREYGFEFAQIADRDGDALPYFINDSMMRIDLPEPLAPGATFDFQVDWEHNIIDEVAVGGRGGYEYFEDEDNYIFALAQWFPRLAAYTDYTGWQNKQFLGRGEFTLEFGDYTVDLTVPSDHIVSATGVLQNPRDVLSATQRRRLDDANADGPIYIVTPEEAAQNAAEKATGTRTWRFAAENVRDFAWSSSRKYIWDAMIFEQDDPDNPQVLAMSFFPEEADPIWSRFSTQAVVHTMDVYNRFAFNYPYPTAQSVNAWERGGMEYPMITFNGYRPYEDTDSGETVYSRNTKYGLIGVIIHEIGHIYFPMTVNSDERRFTWMDEGINTFLEYMAEYEWEENFPIRRDMQNPLDEITRYMTSSNQVPIMTQSDSVLQFGPNAYAKPAAALIVLRETVMGREAFDFAFREYSRRWKFKRPTPEDFFRTMEDASAVDLDWFWRGWFFGTDHVDMAITDVREYRIGTNDPDVEGDLDREEDLVRYPENIVQRRNREEGRTTRVERFEDLNDFYNENDKFAVSNADRNTFQDFLDGLKDWERKAYDRAMEDGKFLYFVDFRNVGGLISPLPLTLNYANGQTEELMIPAEIWRRDSRSVSKLIVRDERIDSILLDAAHQTADADHSNNGFPQSIVSDRLTLARSDAKQRSLMADMLRELKADEKGEPETRDGSGDVPLQRAEGVPDGRADSAPETPDEAPDEAGETGAENTDAAETGAEETDAEDEDRRRSLRETLRRMLGRDQ
ncbi:M1 family metallopeptidase [uncultured Algimonas sp.]|uniref:M1 family metallopeptidase n=1 Tax=uncultured Algimonas sp. TaxID=1547920 RepID=UPI002619CDCF|nr:M1 family metallopeptidase [uncultured Algimonas sp.]